MKSTLQPSDAPSIQVELSALHPFHMPAENRLEVTDKESEEPSATPAQQIRLLRQVYNLRRLRSRLLPSKLFAEPSWDMLIDLYIADLQGRQISTSSACIASSTTASTGLRHLAMMQSLGLVERRCDPRDGRRIFVSLTPSARTAMHRWVHAALVDLSRHDAPAPLGAPQIEPLI